MPGLQNRAIVDIPIVLRHEIDVMEDETIPVPLKNVQISTQIVDFVSEIKVTQTYLNVESNPIEAVYMFPVEEEAAVISFEAQVDNRKISNQVKFSYTCII